MKSVAGILAVVVSVFGIASGASASPSLSIVIKQGNSDVAPLKAKIACFVTLGFLKPTCAALLTNTLTAAGNRANDENFDQAIALINSFILYVNRYEAAGQLPPWAANCLRSMALDLISLWGEGQGG